MFRPIPRFTPEELDRFKAEAENYVGATYGWWKLGFQLADKVVFGGRKVLTTTLNVKSRPICSFLAAYANYAAQDNVRVADRVLMGLKNGAAMYPFGIPPQAADPDSMMDFCLEHPELWMEVK